MFGGSSFAGLIVFLVEVARDASVSSSTQTGSIGRIAAIVGAEILLRLMFRFSIFDSSC
jgi:hypothetical protein